MNKWNKENKEIVKFCVKRWRIENNERYKFTERERCRRRRIRNKFRYLAKTHNMRAYFINSSCSLLTEELLKESYSLNICKNGSLLCGICTFIIDGSFSIDHLIPLSRGGSNSIDNICFAHKICNSRKGTLTLEEYNKRLIQGQRYLQNAEANQRPLSANNSPSNKVE